MLTLFLLLRRRLRQVDERRIAASVLRILIGALAMGVALIAFSGMFASRGAVFVAVVGMLLGILVYFVVTGALRSEEIGFVLKSIRAKS
jgi:hypothetical protein